MFKKSALLEQVTIATFGFQKNEPQKKIKNRLFFFKITLQ